MATIEKTAANGYNPCVNCGEVLHRKMMTQHLKYACESIPGKDPNQPLSDLPPGSYVGVGTAQHKKAWTWADLEERYPRENWVSERIMYAPLGGVVWNGLHVDFQAGVTGCFRTTGNKPGRVPIYERKIPNPHYDTYVRSLDSDMRVNQQPEIGIGTAVPPSVGPLEPQVFIDTETGDRVADPY
ncbi:hypothetical protein CMI37_19495 [Candidatus Pacearchaeota archaeon]|nr:hypothetical protein [Candidatus Pacearchaeota archaeon]